LEFADDIHASPQMRCHLAQTLLQRAIGDLVS
jgi:hypothetical protein